MHLLGRDGVSSKVLLSQYILEGVVFLYLDRATLGLQYAVGPALDVGG